jgi:hypothetical protein
MPAGVYALLGVILGGAITWLAQYRGEWRKRVVEARGAVRLLNAELETADRRVRLAADGGRWWSGDALTLTSWEQDKRLFAAILRERSWWGVQAAIAYVHQLNAMRELYSEGARGPMSETEREEVRAILVKLAAKRGDLQDLVIGIEPWRLRLKIRLRRVLGLPKLSRYRVF